MNGECRIYVFYLEIYNRNMIFSILRFVIYIVCDYIEVICATDEWIIVVSYII